MFSDEFELCYPSPDAKQQAEYETILQVAENALTIVVISLVIAGFN